MSRIDANIHFSTQQLGNASPPLARLSLLGHSAREQLTHLGPNALADQLVGEL